MNGKIKDLSHALYSRFEIPAWMYNAEVFCIKHYYNIGDQRVFIKRKNGNISPVRAAVYCQFLAEQIFSEDACVSNFGIAAALIHFYGFRTFPRVSENYEKCTIIEMYEARDCLCGHFHAELMNDASLHRDGMKPFLEPFLE